MAGDVTNVPSSVLSFNTYSWTNRAKLKTASDSTSTINYLYGLDGLMIKSNNSFHYRSESNLQVTQDSIRTIYTYGPTGLVAMHKLDTVPQTYWYQFGPQGETRELTDSVGNVTDTYLYTSYGENLSSSGTTTNPFRYGGRFGYFTEASTGLLLAGQRWYSPQLLRWLSRDPIHYEGGVNLYQYVSGNPVKYVDPSGLEVYNPNDHSVWPRDEDGNWFELPPHTWNPASPDGWYDPQTRKTYKTGAEKGYGNNKVICEGYNFRRRCNITSPCRYDFRGGIPGPYSINPKDHGWVIPDKTPEQRKDTQPLPWWWQLHFSLPSI